MKSTKKQGSGLGHKSQQAGLRKEESKQEQTYPGCRQKVECIAELRDAIHFDGSERHEAEADGSGTGNTAEERTLRKPVTDYWIKQTGK